MKPGDHVFAKSGLRTLLGYGVVASDYIYDEDRPEAEHVRKVEWKLTGNWQLAETRRITGKTLTDFRPYPEWLRDAWAVIHDRKAPAAPPAELPGTYSLEQALEDVFLPADTFQRIVDVLASKK